MCGINGFNFRNEELIKEMNRLTAHRGPDGSGIFLDEDISLGHNRLSIIDPLERSNQPMSSFDGTLEIVYNGEIYNFKELKKELEGFYPFKTQSDTEVILAAHRKWGTDFVKRLNGIFALALWDKNRKELFLARDPMGVKPLYYFFQAGQFIFSSEIKAILAHEMKRTLNVEAFHHYLRVLYVPEPLTMFQGIHKLPPAATAVLSGGQLKLEKYWEIKKPDYLAGTKKDIAKEVASQVEIAVERQLVSDKPLGVYLSGGIDSSCVLDAMSQCRSRIETFSLGFELSAKEESAKFNQDFLLAGKTAAYYGTKHHAVLLSPAEVWDHLEKAVWHLDEPIANPTIIPMLKLARFSKQNVDVVLGGDGGDELFGGYVRFRHSYLLSLSQKFIPTPLRNRWKSLRKYNTPAGIQRFALFLYQKDHILKQILPAGHLNTPNTDRFFQEKYFQDNPFLTFEENFMNVDRQSWLVDESLMRTDKMSMAAGLEVRVPLLDKELVELAARIPLKYKVSMFQNKIILKEAFKKRIPAYLFKQPKRGWFSPGAKWLRYPQINTPVREALTENYWPENKELMNWAGVKNMVLKHYDTTEYNAPMIWALLIFQLWAKQYKVG